MWNRNGLQVWSKFFYYITLHEIRLSDQACQKKQRGRKDIGKRLVKEIWHLNESCVLVNLCYTDWKGKIIRSEVGTGQVVGF